MTMTLFYYYTTRSFNIHSPTDILSAYRRILLQKCSFAATEMKNKPTICRTEIIQNSLVKIFASSFIIDYKAE